ncbi:MAG TPA: Xaa-Pro peptidase family protein [Terriglobales bacterium]|nr:Xaa-Pro peptidase family protein [Terriglobales bacterium]
MLSRRRLMQLGVAATAALAVSAQAEEAPAIANLKSMKDRAVPITAAERQSRQEKARQLMQQHQLDGILVMAGTSLRYFSGIDWFESERFMAMVLPAKGDPFYVSPAFEEGRIREQITNGLANNSPDVRAWQEDQDPYKLIAQGLKDRGIATGTIGLEETFRYVFSDGVARAAVQTKLTSATTVTAGCRMIKSPAEIALMRLAAHVTLTAYEAAYHSIKDGMTKPEFEDLVAQAHTKLGFTGSGDALVGEFAAFPHGSVTPQVIHEGSLILVDGECLVEGYNSDITRTFVFGKPTAKMNQVFEIVHNAQSAALKTARPGVECQSVDAAARKVITDAGYGPDYKYFTHRLGHGLGMDGHEWPYLVRGNTTKLGPNMTFSDEPGIYIRGEFGVRLEDDMHVTEDGAELFTPQSQSLETPFAKS